MAIRRPNKPPTSGTQVYNAIARNGAQFVETTITSVGFPTDLSIVKGRNLGGVNVEWCWQDRLRAIPYWLQSSATDAEIYDAQNITQYGMNGVTFGTNLRVNGNAVNTYSNYFFKRAPGFFDVVCGTGFGNNKAHNLTVIPEFIIFKQRNVAYQNWYAYIPNIPINLSTGRLNTTAAFDGNNNVAATSTTFDTLTQGGVGTETYVAYLFATLTGISKVGSYTGNGTSQNINCDFAAGARFVLIKRTDSTGDWYTWDTARGIVTGNDPHLSLNTTVAEVTTDDSIDPYSAGFIVNQIAATNINVTSATYIYLAIA